MIFSGNMQPTATDTPCASRPTRPATKRWARSLSLVVLLAFWQLISLWFSPELLPAPVEVMTVFWQQMQSGVLPHHMGITLWRVVISFTLAMLLGSLLGMAMGRFKALDDWLDSALTLTLHIPALVTIMLCFVWLGLSEVAALTAVIINKIPNVAVTMREGARATDGRLMQVATAYQLSRWRTFRKVYLPQLAPYFMAAARSSLALVWKIVLVVELLGCSEGVGFQLGSFFQFFDITSILAYTLAFAGVIYAVEGLVLRPWERRISRWRVC